MIMIMVTWIIMIMVKSVAITIDYDCNSNRTKRYATAYLRLQMYIDLLLKIQFWDAFQLNHILGHRELIDLIIIIADNL